MKTNDPYDMLRPERLKGETYEAYKIRRKLAQIIVKNYLRNGKQVEEDSEE